MGKNLQYYSLINLVTKELVQLSREIHYFKDIYVLSPGNDVIIISQSPPSFRRWQPGDENFRNHSFSDINRDPTLD